jgi:hypothetical protein
VLPWSTRYVRRAPEPGAAAVSAAVVVIARAPPLLVRGASVVAAVVAALAGIVSSSLVVAATWFASSFSSASVPASIAPVALASIPRERARVPGSPAISAARASARAVVRSRIVVVRLGGSRS